jgi:hypothetical protein
LVARPGAHLQHALGAREGEGLGHQADDERLRDGLAGADGQRRVAVGVGAVLGRDELLAGHRADRREHALVVHTLAA